MPKYLGGSDNRANLLSIPTGEHIALHTDMRTFFKKEQEYNILNPKRGWDGARIQAETSGEFRLQAVANFYMMYKDKYPVEWAAFFKLYPQTWDAAIRYCEAHPHYNIYARYNKEFTPE